MRGLTARSARRAGPRTPVRGGGAGPVVRVPPQQMVVQPQPPAEQASLGELLARLTQDGGPGATKALIRDLGVAAAASGRKAGGVAIASGRWFGDVLIEAAPHLPVRDLETLRLHHGGLEGEALADLLVRHAAFASAAVGAGGGALAAVSWGTAVGVATIPLQLAVEALAVAAIEVKLVAELHEVYGLAVAGTGTERGLAYAAAWANRRGASPTDPKATLAVLTWTTRARIQRRIVARTGRSIGVAAPFLLGAAYGAWLNKKTTDDLADQMRLDLRRRRPLTGGPTGHLVRRGLRFKR